MISHINPATYPDQEEGYRLLCDVGCAAQGPKGRTQREARWLARVLGWVLQSLDRCPRHATEIYRKGDPGPIYTVWGIVEEAA